MSASCGIFRHHAPDSLSLRPRHIHHAPRRDRRAGELRPADGGVRDAGEDRDRRRDRLHVLPLWRAPGDCECDRGRRALAAACARARVHLRDVPARRPPPLSSSAAMARARPARFGHALSLSLALHDPILARLHLDRRRQCSRGDVLGDAVKPDRRGGDAASCRDFRVSARRRADRRRDPRDRPPPDCAAGGGPIVAAVDRRLRPAPQGDSVRDRSGLDPARGLWRLRPRGQRRLWRALPISGFAS